MAVRTYTVSVLCQRCEKQFEIHASWEDVSPLGHIEVIALILPLCCRTEPRRMALTVTPEGGR